MFLGVLESVEEQHPAPLSEFAQPMAIVGYILELHIGPVRVIRPPVVVGCSWTSVMRGYSGSATTPRLCPRSTP
jgi:hypothetical protein